MRLFFACLFLGVWVFCFSSLSWASSVARSYQDLLLEFQYKGYHLDEARAGEKYVPWLYISHVPGDLKQAETSLRKEVFIRIMLPLILKVNKQLSADRARLLSIQIDELYGTGALLKDMDWVRQQCEEYGVDDKDWMSLTSFIDEIPVSLALAQAALESGWGTSRFVREGNAVYGEWTWKGPGMFPRIRKDGKNQHKVKSFPNLMDSVKSYFHALNSKSAYRSFRRERAELRDEGKLLDGVLLAGTMQYYSQLRDEYVKRLRIVIQRNNLTDFDGVKFSG